MKDYACRYERQSQKVTLETGVALAATTVLIDEFMPTEAFIEAPINEQICAHSGPLSPNALHLFSTLIHVGESHHRDVNSFSLHVLW